jgi:ribosomal protein L29
MKVIKVTKLSDEDLKKNLEELRKESLRLKNLRVTRMLAKESGSVKSVRRNMARVLAEMKKRGIKS